jgi:hypothetical protein
MYKIDNISVLKNVLSTLDPNKLSIVFTNEAEYHSVITSISKARLTRKYFILPLNPVYIYKRRMKWQFLMKIKRSQINIEKKFGCSYFFNAPKGLNIFMYKNGLDHICFMDFAIFGASYLKCSSEGIFDEVFINGYEDHDVSLKFSLENRNYAFIQYKIGDYVGSILGTGITRELRNLVGLIYLNYKYEEKISVLI